MNNQAFESARGYSKLSVFAHWVGALIVVVLFVTHEGRDGDIAWVIHVGGGALGGIFLLWRVGRRVRRGMTVKPAQAALLNVASSIVMWGFLLALVVVTVTGYLLPWSLGEPLNVFGYLLPSPLPRIAALHEVVEELHEVSGHLFAPLLLLHILGTLKHALIDKDGVASRMFKSVIDGR